MRAESQSMLIEAAQGQETIQAIFAQTLTPRKGVILNCQFERDPADGDLYYVFSGTADHYMQFRELMSDYGVKPAHEIAGHRFNPETQKQADEEAGTAAPVVDTAPVETKSTADTSESPDLSTTEGVVVTPSAEGGVDVTPLRSSADANSGQPSTGDAGQGGASAGDQSHDRGGSGAGAAAGGAAGRKAAVADAQRPVDGQGVEADPFAALTGAEPAPAAKADPFADM